MFVFFYQVICHMYVVLFFIFMFSHIDQPFIFMIPYFACLLNCIFDIFSSVFLFSLLIDFFC